MPLTDLEKQKLVNLSLVACLSARSIRTVKVPFRWPEATLAILKKIEWEGDNYIFKCPYCAHWKQVGHGSSCPLTVLIKQLEKYLARRETKFGRDVAKSAAADGAKKHVPSAAGRSNHNGRKRAAPRKRV